MKAEYIPLSPAGAAALLMAGSFAGQSWSMASAGAPALGWGPGLLIGALMLLYARSDARDPIASGRFKANCFGVWRRHEVPANVFSEPTNPETRTTDARESQS